MGLPKGSCVQPGRGRPGDLPGVLVVGGAAADNAGRGEEAHLVGLGLGIEVAAEDGGQRRGRVTALADGLVDEEHLMNAMVRMRGRWAQVSAEHIDASSTGVEQLELEPVEGIRSLAVSGQWQQLAVVDRPAAQDRRAEPHASIGPYLEWGTGSHRSTTAKRCCCARPASRRCWRTPRPPTPPAGTRHLPRGGRATPRSRTAARPNAGSNSEPALSWATRERALVGRGHVPRGR